MTVCVAALCGNKRMVVGASDRMLTAGDGTVQFEPQQSKISKITSSLVIMTAGDSALQAEIINKVYEDVGERIRLEPENWWRIEDVARLYRKHFLEIRSRKAANEFLTPLGLDAESFIDRNQDLDPDLARELALELINYESDGVEAIVTGVDTTGAHLFVVDNNNFSCLDSVGFASIGIGSAHSNSQFMFSRYTSKFELPDAMFECYTAKKRGEVASGVGTDTDMYFITGLGRYGDVGGHLIDKLRSIYKRIRQSEVTILKNGREKYYNYVEQVIETTTKNEQEQETSDDAGEASANETEI